MLLRCGFALTSACVLYVLRSVYKVAHLSRSLEERRKVFVQAFGTEAKYFDETFGGKYPSAHLLLYRCNNLYTL